jgi:hypothetical protein
MRLGLREFSGKRFMRKNRVFLVMALDSDEATSKRVSGIGHQPVDLVGQPEAQASVLSPGAGAQQNRACQHPTNLPLHSFITVLL